jgi:acetoin utilization protein AcuC
VSQSVSVLWNDALREYDFGPGHPFSSVRVALAMRLIDEFGLLDHSNVTVVDDFPVATQEELRLNHTADFIAAVQRAGQDPAGYGEAHGIGTPDTPAFAGMHTAAARVVGATLQAARLVHSGQAQHAVHIAGGLHHGMSGRASGFCVYNDISVAIRWLLEQGVERIAYVDVDVHHGDGVQDSFWNDPRVLTISIHESPATLFPGTTGWPSEVGGPDALGTAVNIALPAGTGDQGWLRALHAVAPKILAEFQPQILVSQHGCDSHFEDPLANLAVSIDGQRMAAEAMHRWAHRYAGGRWIAVGGGGYEWVEVVPRAWTHLMAIAVGKPIKPQTPIPAGFHDYVLELMGRQAPFSMTDGFDPWPKNWSLGHDPADPVDAAVLATRRAVFPHLGIITESGIGF